jgi:hypothetical protein
MKIVAPSSSHVTSDECQVPKGCPKRCLGPPSVLILSSARPHIRTAFPFFLLASLRLLPVSQADFWKSDQKGQIQSRPPLREVFGHDQDCSLFQQHELLEWRMHETLSFIVHGHPVLCVPWAMIREVYSLQPDSDVFQI